MATSEIPNPNSSTTFDGRPLLKWVGGKTELLSLIAPYYQGQSTIIEPFFGGGALSFSLAGANPRIKVIGNDTLSPLVQIYQAIAADADAFIAEVGKWATPYLACPDKASRRAFYYKTRAAYLAGDIDGPAVLLFMVRVAYCGLYRESKTYPGRFGTAHGMGEEKPGFYFPDRLRAAGPVMKNWTLTSTDFFETLQYVDADTFVLLDPPYRDTFTSYAATGFTAADQDRVVRYFHEAVARGATVVYTNKATGDNWYQENFPTAKIVIAPKKYKVNGNCATVGRVQSYEVIISASAAQTVCPAQTQAGSRAQLPTAA